MKQYLAVINEENIDKVYEKTSGLIEFVEVEGMEVMGKDFQVLVTRNVKACVPELDVGAECKLPEAVNG